MPALNSGVIPEEMERSQTAAGIENIASAGGQPGQQRSAWPLRFSRASPNWTVAVLLTCAPDTVEPAGRSRYGNAGIARVADLAGRLVAGVAGSAVCKAT